jgi:UDP-N-acetylmuramoyl-L-alanyl-D-glutamate--2,6-diaminopimelate ligase
MKLSSLIPTDKDIEVTGVSYHSERVNKGDVFVAIEGQKEDGSGYAAAAIEKGAVCVVSEKRLYHPNVPCVIVDNARVALAQISHKLYGEPSKRLKLIGVTGTNGKTTVTHLIRAVLERDGHKTGLIGTNYNYDGNTILPSSRTTPESADLAKLLYEMAENGCEYAVMEVSSHSLKLHRVHGCEFEVGVFTNLTQDHLDFHISMEDYLLTKAKLFEMCKKAVINIDDKGGEYIMQNAKCPITTYGMGKGDICASAVSVGKSGVSFSCDECSFSLKIPGKFSIYNALSAIGACKAVGVSTSTIKSAMEECEGVKGRMEIVPTNRNFTVIIDYAHTPDGLLNVLKTVKDAASGRVVVLFGCGGDRDKSKRSKMGEIAGKYADFCIVTSDNPRSEDPSEIIRDILSGMKNASAEYVVVENRRDAIEYALRHGREDDVIILAGKGHEDYQELKDGKIHFDEREIIAEILSEN